MGTIDRAIPPATNNFPTDVGRLLVNDGSTLNEPRETSNAALTSLPNELPFQAPGAVEKLRADRLSLFLRASLDQPTSDKTAAGASTAQGEKTEETQQLLPPGVEKMASVEGITEYRLQNGLRVLLLPDQSKPSITVNTTYLVGSRHENYGETGMAHLLEHLLFKGSPRHPNPDNEFSARGVTVNGTTSFDRTNYFETFQASDENLEWALDLGADRMVNSFIAEKDLKSEFSVVRNEFEMGENNSLRVLFDKVLATAYQWHNYGNTTIGARSDIENVPIERLQAFYRTYYQPDNAVLMVSGKIDEAKTLELIDKYFSSIPRPTHTLPKQYTQEPRQDGERAVVVRRAGEMQLAIAGYHIPPGSHPDYAAIEVMTQILGDDTSGRLHQSLVETQKAVSASSEGFQLNEPGYLAFYTELRKEMSLDEASATLVKTIEEFAANPPTAEEVERAKINLLREIESDFNDPENIGIKMSESIALGDWRLAFVHRDRLRDVTPADVQRVAQAYLKSSNRTLGQFIPTDKPERAEIPRVSNADVQAMVRDYKGAKVIAPGEVFDPSPANIENRIKRLNINGLNVALLPKENRGDTVVATLTLNFGDENSLMNRAPAAEFAREMLLRGTTKHTRQQIQEELDRLKARVSISGNSNNAQISLETTRENLSAAVRIIGEVLREPAFAANEFETLRQERLAHLENQKSDPASRARESLWQHFNLYPKGHPLYAATLDEQISNVQSVTPEQARQFYNDFYGASSGQMSIIGDFDEKEIAALTTEIFGDWKSSRPFARIGLKYQDLAALNQTIETPDKTNAFIIAGLKLNLRDDAADYPALMIANEIFGGGSGLSSRLIDRLRQKEGLSYSAGSQLAVSATDRVAHFITQAIYAPQNAGKVEAAFKEEIDRMLRDGFTAEELTAAKSGWRQRQQLLRSQDSQLSRRTNQYLFTDRTFAWDAELEKRVQSLTLEEVNEAAHKYITPDQITIIKAGDFAGAERARR